MFRTFNLDLLSICEDRQHSAPPAMAATQTYGELDLCGPHGRGSKGPAAIEGRTQRRPPQRPDELLPQHCEARGWRESCTAKLRLDVDDIAAMGNPIRSLAVHASAD
jgi:hypothetical protein